MHYTNVYINRGIHRALKDAGKEDLLRLPSNRRPDVMFVTKDGKYHFREVASKTDRVPVLDMRMQDLRKELPESMRGGHKTFKLQDTAHQVRQAFQDQLKDLK